MSENQLSERMNVKLYLPGYNNQKELCEFLRSLWLCVKNIFLKRVGL